LDLSYWGLPPFVKYNAFWKKVQDKIAINQFQTKSLCALRIDTDLRSKTTLPIDQNAANAVAASICQYRLESKSV